MELRFVNSEAWRDEIVDQLFWTGAQIFRVLKMAYYIYRILWLLNVRFTVLFSYFRTPNDELSAEST